MYLTINQLPQIAPLQQVTSRQRFPQRIFLFPFFVSMNRFTYLFSIITGMKKQQLPGGEVVLVEGGKRAEADVGTIRVTSIRDVEYESHR